MPCNAARAEKKGTTFAQVRLSNRTFGDPHLSQQRIVAIGLLTEHDLALLGEGFNRAWPIDETPCFEDLIKAIDEADRALCSEQKSEIPPPAKC